MSTIRRIDRIIGGLTFIGVVVAQFWFDLPYDQAAYFMAGAAYFAAKGAQTDDLP